MVRFAIYATVCSLGIALLMAVFSQYRFEKEPAVAGRMEPRGGLPTGNPEDPGDRDPWYPWFSFGSLHDGVVLFAMADGSVRPINKLIDHGIVRLLAMRADGAPIPDEF